MMHCSFYLHQPSEIAVYYTLYIRERLISTARSSLMTPFEENRAAHRVANQFRTLTKTRVCFFLDKLSRWCGKSSGCVTYTYRDITYKSRSHDQTLKRSERVYFSLYVQDLYFERAMIRVKYCWNVFFFSFIYMFVLRIDIIAAWSSLRHLPGHFS